MRSDGILSDGVGDIPTTLLYCLDGRYRKVERHLIPFYFDELIRVDGDLGMR